MNGVRSTGTYVFPVTEESDNFGTLSGPFNVTIKVIECINFGPEIKLAAHDYHIDELTLAAIAAQETGGPGSDNATNIIGDNGHGYGLFQIDDRWHSDFISSGQALNPQQNSFEGANILLGFLNYYGGDMHKAINAYNGGYGSTDAETSPTLWPDGQTRSYYDSVQKHLSDLNTHNANLACGSS